jgi:penicillin amidase
MQAVPTVLRVALGRRRPMVDGVMILPGLNAPVTVRRDRYGIAYIDAQDEAGAWFGLGFCQAQERAFQLELRLRTIRGTLSQVIGEETLGIDRLSRRIGFVEASRRQWSALDADVKAQIEAFVRGINAGLATSNSAPEFALLRAKPTPWTVEDVLGMGKLISFLLIGNWDVELTRLKILLLDGADALRDLDPTPYPPGHVVVASLKSESVESIDHLGADIEAFMAFAGGGGGSNAWAVAGSKTRSGLPILANDPHLEGVLPPHWYLTHIATPEWSVAGASMIGAPAIAAGHNGFAAWGLTAGLADTVDLFLEDVSPDGRSARRGEGYEQCEVRREIIEVKGKAPAIEDVLVTPRGPVISPALDGELPALSLRAVWLDPLPARGFLRVHKARSFEAFRREFERWPLFSQNVVYADTTSVGWQLVGQVPVRNKGFGTLPLPAADVETGWQEEMVPFDAMPFAVNPPSGFVVTANNRPGEAKDGVFLGLDWLDGYRAGRAAEVLAGNDAWDVAATQALQMDVESLTWREIRDIVLALAPEGAGGDLSLALGLLRGWDGCVSANSVAATVFERFVREMSRRIAEARAPKSAAWAMGRGFDNLLNGTTFAAGRQSRVLRRLVEQPEGWFGAGWPAEMRDALVRVIADLRAAQGANPTAWRWGTVRPLILEHPIGRIKALAPVFNRGPFAWGGDGNTVSQASGSHSSVIASLRMVVPIGDWEAARFVLPGGQSGNPFSPHYDDQLPLWKQGSGLPIGWSEEAVRAATVHTLRLEPL